MWEEKNSLNKYLLLFVYLFIQEESSVRDSYQ